MSAEPVLRCPTCRQVVTPLRQRRVNWWLIALLVAALPLTLVLAALFRLVFGTGLPAYVMLGILIGYIPKMRFAKTVLSCPECRATNLSDR